jgi:hypothetical protein
MLAPMGGVRLFPVQQAASSIWLSSSGREDEEDPAAPEGLRQALALPQVEGMASREAGDAQLALQLSQRSNADCLWSKISPHSRAR